MRKKIVPVFLAVLMALFMGIAPAFAAAWTPTFKPNPGYSQSLQIPADYSPGQAPGSSQRK